MEDILKLLWELISSLLGKKKKKKKKDDKPKFEDDIDPNQVVWHGYNVANWEITHDIKMNGRGGTISLDQTATKDWPTKYDVVGNCWFFKLKGNKWNAYQWDFIRPGQHTRHFPWYPPKPGHGNYETVKKDEQFCVMISGLCRDHRRNVSKRTRIAKVQ